MSPEDLGTHTVRLRSCYFAAGVREYWLVDARSRRDLSFRILTRGKTDYDEVAASRAGFSPSALLERDVRLIRAPSRLGLFDYTLELRRPRRRTTQPKR